MAGVYVNAVFDDSQFRKYIENLPDELQEVTATALNTAAKEGMKIVKNEVTDEYHVKRSEVDKAFKERRRARKRALTAVLEYAAAPIPLSAFMTKKQSAGQVQIKIKRKEAAKVLVKAFVAEMTSGHVGVFYKGAKTIGKTHPVPKTGRYKGKKRAFDPATGKMKRIKHGLPIDEQATLSITRMISSKKVGEDVAFQLWNLLPAIFKYEYERLVARKLKKAGITV